MSINCGIQCISCDFPIHFDTYKGCSHACKYCFVKSKYDISNVKPINTTKSLRNFINGGRNFETRWCDWNIPLHWGGNSDPFQPCEREHHKSLDCLKILAETKYPFMVSTKNPALLLEEPYYSTLKECNCVVQISMACSKYDKLEQGAIPYEERLKTIKPLSEIVHRVIVRARPYFPDCHKDILKEIPRYAEAGAYALNVSSFISKKKQKGMKRYGNSYMFDSDLLYRLYKELKTACHDNGLVFLCAEADLEHMSDSLNCCGSEGLEGFVGNKFNRSHMALDEEYPEPTDAMKQPDTYQPFKCIGQSQVWANKCKGKTFEELMHEICDEQIDYIKQMRERYK